MSEEDIVIKEYILQNSYVPVDFIDDLYYAMFVDKNVYPITIDKAAECLNIYRRTLRDTVVNTYEENLDFIREKGEYVKRRGGHKRMEVLLSTDTLKKICSKSRSKESHKVSTYIQEMIKHHALAKARYSY